MPLQFRVEDRIAEPQWIQLAPFEEFGFALEAHGMGREAFARTRPLHLYADAPSASEEAKASRAFVATRIRRRCVTPTRGEAPPKLKPQIQVHRESKREHAHHADQTLREGFLVPTHARLRPEIATRTWPDAIPDFLGTRT